MANVFELNVNINSTVKSEAEKSMENVSLGSLTNVSGKMDQGLSKLGQKASKSGHDVLGKSLKGAGAIGVASAVVDIGTKVVTNRLSRYGRLYGDQARQNRIDNAMSVAGDLMEAGGTIAAGAMAGGVPGAIVGAVVAVVDKAVEIAENLKEYSYNQQENRFESQRESERIGMIAISGGR